MAFFSSFPNMHLSITQDHDGFLISFYYHVDSYPSDVVL